MKKIILISIILLCLFGCENPVAPQSENEFIIELYSYTAGANTSPNPNRHFIFQATSASYKKYIIDSHTNESGRYTIILTDKDYNHCNYTLGFGNPYNGIIEFGKTHIYKCYN